MRHLYCLVPPVAPMHPWSTGAANRQRFDSVWLEFNAGTHSPSLAFGHSLRSNLTTAARVHRQRLDGGASALAEALSFRPALAGTFRPVRRRQPDCRGANGGLPGPFVDELTWERMDPETPGA